MKRPIFKRSRSAFTMLELTFVMIILGIVASIASQIIVQVYEQYIVQRAQYKASFKTELAAYQIANRLRYAIPGSIYRIDKNTPPNKEAITTSFPAGKSGDDYIGIQWVGYDREGFELTKSATPRKPGWSGFCDLNQSSKNVLKTPGSNLPKASMIISNLGGNIIGSAIYFAKETNTSVFNQISGVSASATGETINLAPVPGDRRMAEQYKLAWTSYALVVENGDLYLYYNFTPQIATNLGNTKKLLLHGVTTFKFTGTENTMRFKICKSEPIGSDVNITSCKEKAVF